MKIFLTGATGYIGGALLEHFVSTGNEVSIIVRPKSHLNSIENLFRNVQVYKYSGNYTELNFALKESNPDIVIHVASFFLANHNPENIHELIDSNINFPTQLLEAMRENGVKHIVNTGTSWQHFDNQEYNPVNLYAATKKAFEDLSEFYIKAYGIKCVTLKLFDTYGPKDARKKLFFLLRQAAKFNSILKMSPGYQLVDLVYISDVVHAYDLAIQFAMEMKSGTETFALSSNQRHTLREVVQIFSEITKVNIQVEWGGLPYREREVMTPWNDFLNLPEWSAKIDLKKGIELMEGDPFIGGLLTSTSN